MWTKYLKFAVAIMFGGSFLMSFNTLLCRSSFRMKEIDGYRVVYLIPEYCITYWIRILSPAIFVFVSMVSELIVNIATIVVWRKKKALLINKNVDYQKSLVILTIAIYLIHLSSVSLKNMFLN
jgi:hypothetical protein